MSSDYQTVLCDGRQLLPCRIATVDNCEVSPSYSEDDCLNRCLVDKFYEDFGCVHARLQHLTERKNYCRIGHLLRHVRIDKNTKESIGDIADPGIAKIKEILNGFDDSR